MENIKSTDISIQLLDILGLLHFSDDNRGKSGILDNRVFPDGLPFSDIQIFKSEDGVKLISNNFSPIVLSGDVGYKLFDYIYDNHLYDSEHLGKHYRDYVPALIELNYDGLKLACMFYRIRSSGYSEVPNYAGFNIWNGYNIWARFIDVTSLYDDMGESNWVDSFDDSVLLGELMYLYL